MVLAQCSFITLLLAGYGWSISAVVFMFTQNVDFNQDFAIYTMASGFLVFFIESYLIYSVCNDSGDPQQLPKALKLVVGCYFGWSIYSLFLFFLYPTTLPSTDKYGGYTISYLIFFSFPLYTPLIILTSFFLMLFQKCCVLYHRYLFIGVFISFFIPLAILNAYVFLTNPDEEQTLTFLCTFASLSLLITLLLTHSILRILDSTPENSIPSRNFLFYQIFINMIFPVLPLAFFSLFLLEIIQKPLFTFFTTYTQLTIVVMFICFVSGAFGPILFSIFVLNEYKSRFIQFFRVRIFDLLFQLEQILQIGEMLIMVIIYFNSEEVLDLTDSVLNVLTPFVFHIVAYSIQSRKLRVLLNYIQYSNQEIQSTINSKSTAIMIVYVVCLVYQITICAIFSNLSQVLKFMQIFFIALTAYNLLFNVTKVWVLSLDTINNLNSNVLNFQDQFLEQPPVGPRLNLEIVLDQVDPDKEGPDVEALYGQVCAICLQSFVDGSVVERQEKPKPISKIKTCGHCFHSECISGWLQSRDFCPLDRKNVRGSSS